MGISWRALRVVGPNYASGSQQQAKTPGEWSFQN